MSFCLKVVLRLLNLLTKILAFNEFHYNRDQKKFVSSRRWHNYVKILHRFLIWPFSILVLLFLILKPPGQELSFDSIAEWVALSMIVIPFMSIAFEGWMILQHSRELCQLLNRLLHVERIHREIFGRSVHVPWYYLTIHLACESYAYWVFTPRIAYSLGAMSLMAARVFVLFYLIDVTMLIHVGLIRSLAQHLDQPAHKWKLQRSVCFAYFEELLHLHKDLQRFVGVLNTARLAANVSYYSFAGLTCFWFYNFYGQRSQLFEALICCLSISNMLHVVQMASSIGGMERKILNRLYSHELLRLLTRRGNSRNWRMEKLEQLHLKRCSRMEGSFNIFNYIYVRRTLNLQIMDYCITNVFLLISFSLIHENRQVFLPNFITISPRS